MSAQLPIEKLQKMLEGNKVPKDTKVVIYTGANENPVINELVTTLAEKNISVVVLDEEAKFNDGAFDIVPSQLTLSEELQKQMYETIKKSMETIGIETEYKSMVEARNRKNNKFNAQQLKNRSRYLNKHPRK